MEVGESMNNGNYTNCCGACCPEVSCTLSQNVDVLEPCDIITYTATCINNDPLVTNAFFRDCLPAPLVFIPGTIYINGVNYPTLSPENGLPISFAALGNTVTITYMARAYGDSCCCVKTTNCQCCRTFRTVCNRAQLCFVQCCCRKTVNTNVLGVQVEY